MSWIISLPEQSTWHLDITLFVQNLQTHWPESVVRRICDPQDIRAVTWEMDMSAGHLDGAFLREGAMICLDGDIDNGAEFAVWFRALVRHTIPLLFHDHGRIILYALEPATTSEDIRNAFSSLWED